MAHLFQVGAGSGGMPVLDMVCRDARIDRVTLVEPDVYKPHNVQRHLFPLSACGWPKGGLAECAADNEPAKYHFDGLMRRHGKPWTLGEVLSGGIGGLVHRFVPGGACY